MLEIVIKRQRMSVHLSIYMMEVYGTGSKGPKFQLYRTMKSIHETKCCFKVVVPCIGVLKEQDRRTRKSKYAQSMSHRSTFNNLFTCQMRSNCPYQNHWCLSDCWIDWVDWHHWWQMTNGRLPWTSENLQKLTLTPPEFIIINSISRTLPQPV